MKHFPADDKKAQIIETVNNNKVSIIVGETGSGKTTRVPQYLLEEGYQVLVSQPRRLAAISVAEYVASEQGEEVGNTVGYATGHEKCNCKNTKILFVTDGLALVRKLLGENSSKKQVLIIDEVHEWNSNIEVLVAWCKEHLDENFKLVLMSATIEAKELSEYFDKAPIIEIEGRLFPVKERDATGNAIADIAALVKESRNVLVFCSGKAHINDVTTELSLTLGSLGLQAEIFPLHGEIPYDQQKKAFQTYRIPKVVIATNVAQTSITIEDIDAVVDFGLEKRLEVVGGVESLVEGWISKADSKQRAGRAGRCKEGIYINYAEKEQQLNFPIPEIKRVNLDHLILKLAVAGFDMEVMDFFHQPDHQAIHRGKELLRLLELMQGNEPTQLGKEVASLPLSPRSGKMLTLCKDEPELLYDMIVGVACLELKGITDRTSSWLSLAMFEKDSDFIAQINVYKNAKNLKYKEMKEKGIFVKDYKRAVEVVKKLLKLFPQAKVHDQKPDKAKLIPIIVENYKDLAFKVFYGKAHAYNPEFAGYRSRKISNQSVTSWPTYVVGIPLDITNKDGHSFPLLTMVTSFSLSLLSLVGQEE